MDDKDFAKEVSRVINLIVEEIEKNDTEDSIDVDLNGDILNFSTKNGLFVINKQSFTKEIWLSSPVSGPHHFSYDGQTWKSRAGLDIFSTLSQDLKMEIKDKH